MKGLSYIYLLFVLFLLPACGSRDKGIMPERLLTEQEMIDVMTDVQIIEADINYQKSQDRNRDPNDTVKRALKDYVKMSKEYYAQLFEHYGITDSIFVQNMRYYAELPVVLERVMDSVVQRLTKEGGK